MLNLKKLYLLPIILLIVSLNFPRIDWLIKDRAWHNQQLIENHATGQIINDYFLKNYPQGGLVLTDILIGFQPPSPFTVWRIKDAQPAYPGATVSFSKVQFIILNKKIKKSPLIDFIFHGDMAKQFTFIKSFDGLALYARSS